MRTFTPAVLREVTRLALGILPAIGAVISGCAQAESVGLEPPALVGIDITPSTVQVAPGGTTQFTVQGRLADGSSSAVTPSFTATGGTVSNGGLYTAGTTSGTFRVIASASGFADTSTVTISTAPPTLVAIELTPATASVQTGGTQQFSVVGRLSNGGTQAVTPTYSATGGTITSGGLYTAGGAAGNFRVIANASGFADTSAVTVTTSTPPTLVAVELTPASVTINTGATQQFSVVGRMSDGSTQAVTPTYSATGGTITSGGLYTAGGTAGNFRAIASASGFADTSSITLTTPGTFAPPDIHSVTFDQAGDDAKFTVLGVSFPAIWHVADANGGRNGSRAMRVNLSLGPLFEPVGVSWTPRSRVFYRWYFRMQGTPGGNVKGIIVRSPNGEKVGDFYGGDPCWSFDREGEAICFDIGLSYTQATANCGALANGQWHSIEVDYNRNAGSNVEARIWCDGNAVVLPPGPAKWGCCDYPAVQFVGGDRATNTPSTIRTARQGQNTFGELTFWETISQGVSGVSIWIDDIAVSTQRIGP